MSYTLVEEDSVGEDKKERVGWKHVLTIQQANESVDFMFSVLLWKEHDNDDESSELY